MDTQEKIEIEKLSQESISELIGRLQAHAEFHLNLRMVLILSALSRKVTELEVKQLFHDTHTTGI